jgi:hypothetical protein
MRIIIGTKIRNKLVFKPFIIGSNRHIYSFLNKVWGDYCKGKVKMEQFQQKTVKSQSIKGHN